MPSPTPFAITPEAPDNMRSHLRFPEPGQELALITVLRQADVVQGKERIWHDGQHFMLGFYNIGERPHTEHIELFGHQVSILPSTLEKLRGHTLALRRVVKRRGWFMKNTRYVLIAT